MTSDTLIAITDRLAIAGVGTLATALGSRIYRDESPADAAMPMMVWTLTPDFARERTFTGSIYTGVLRATIFADKVNATNALSYADKLVTALDNWSTSHASAYRLFTKRTKAGTASFEEDIWTINEEYEVRIYTSL